MRRIATALASTTLLAAALTGQATTAAEAVGVQQSPDMAPMRCGYYEDSFYAWYNHCAPDGSHVWIIVWYENSSTGNGKCVGPGVTWLGYAIDIEFAEYVPNSHC